MLEFLNQNWQLNILLGGLLIAGVCALLSTYVVLRKMAMLSEGVAHSAIGGYGVALLLAYYLPSVFNHPTYGSYLQQFVAAAFCVGTALLIDFITQRKKVSEDSAIGIFLVATVALGILLIQFRIRLEPSSVPTSIEGILFGRLVAITPHDTVNAGILAVITFGLVALFYNELLYTTLDEEMARINGVNTRLMNIVLSVLIAIVIVLGTRMVGALMIVALMVLPGAIANMLSRRFLRVLLASVAVGIIGPALALSLAIYYPAFANYSPGPIIVLALFGLFCLVWLFRHLYRPAMKSSEASNGK